jgi:hypothetical protein
MTYISNAVPTGDGTSNLVPLGEAAKAGHLTMGAIGKSDVLTTVTINNQGLVDVIQAAVTGLDAKQPYFLATSTQADGSGVLTPIAKFMSNPAGAAIVDAVGALRSALDGRASSGRSYRVVASDQDGKPGQTLQVSR